MQLAIDTSTDTAGLALLEEGQLKAEVSWRSGQSHTTELLPTLSRLLKQHRLSIESLKAVIVAKGPGSFNGLRVGLSTAKGLALSLKIPIVGISTLAAEAYRYTASGKPVCPIFEAGRGEIAAAIYQQQEGQWCRRVAEHITTVAALCSEISGRTVFCGQPSEATAAEIKKKLKDKAVFPPPAALPRVVCLAELGLKRLAAADYDDPASLQPLYLRRPPITRPKRPVRLTAK